MDTVVLFAYFNFSNSKARHIALVKTLTSLSGYVDIILVCYGLAPDIILQSKNIKIIHIPSASIVWQKERFYNVALSHLNKNHKYVIWADADILFTHKNWQEQLKEKLEKYQLVQLFNRVEDIKLENGSFFTTGSIRQSVVLSFDRHVTIENYFSQSGISLKIGCNPGFAWGAKAATIKNICFPDFMILGSGDKVLLASALGYHSLFFKTLSLNPTLYNMYHSWGDKVFHAIGGQISYLDNTIYHIVQGEYQNRRYGNRYQLIEGDLKSIADRLKINQYGAWQWKNENNEYAIKIKRYFNDRGD